MADKRMIAIGLEAVEPTLLEKWCEEGHLPTLASLRDRGAYRRIWGPSEISSSSTWPSINCGVTPGKHGMAFIHRQFASGTYDTVRKRADDIGRDPFWLDLDKAGKRIFTMDVPETRTYGLNGVEVVGWGLEYKTWKVDSTPKGLVQDILKRYGNHPLDGWYQTKESTAEAWLDIKEKLLGAAKTRVDIVREIMAKEKFDFSLIAYGETHFAGHLFWHINDPQHPDYDPELEKAVGQPILEIYKACDQGLKEIIEMDPEATVLVFSNTGMGPNYSGRHFVGEVLGRLGYRAEKVEREAPKKSGLPAGDVFAIERIEKMIGQRNIEKVKSLIPEKIWDVVTRKFLTMGSDWKDCLAFDIPSDNTGTIRINLKGREPKGKVDPADYDALCDKIAEQFMELVHPETGEKLVSEIVKPHEKYPGDYSADLPDLVIKWVPGKDITVMTSPEVGEIRRDHLPDARTGAHQDVGFFVAVGEGIRHIDGQKEGLEQAYNWDVAPTVLKYFGLPVPEDMDGKPMDDILDDTEQRQTDRVA